ncbi:amidase [Nioella sediminis]|jgi:aspartyl-tRNA(Asn)/glutamyl-tRNA(Gln) amidotransferase subunit A|uniref:amidase n=1 Tax=Nioella sediminis TaxID=1912092 RepID=UPI0008FD9097|nr:amidase family protein [Nioella sediminis]TBX28223.1 amidase [Roseovarius sp. JS7-11]
MRDDWQTLGVADLGRAIGAGEIDPAELTEAYLEAIAGHEYAGRIYSVVTPERARAEAAAASERARLGVRRGLLDGVPLSWKDLFDSAGDETKSGSDLLAGRVPDEDCEVLANATRAGMVCLGKTHMSELAFSGLGINPVTETPPNIHDPELVPGGSSSGAAASTAWGLAPAGIGSDTGGSVRIPSAFNDLVGLKTTSGRLSLTGVVPLCARFDTVGPLAKSVEDCALLLAVMEGSKPTDLEGVSLKGRRFLVLDTYTDDVREEPAAGFAHAIDRMAQAGAQISHGTVDGIEAAMDLSPILFTSEAYGTWKHAIEAAPEKMFPRILDRFRSGAGFAAADYVSAWQFLDHLRGDWAAQVAGYDAVLLPTAPNLPPHAGRLMEDDDYYVTENLLTLRNTRVGNLMGLSALTIPTGVPGTGIMLLGQPFGEEALLRIGKAVETALA